MLGVRQRARLIYNPSSGKELLRNKLATMLDILEEGGWETSCHATKSESDAVDAASFAAADGYECVIAAGGDGTIHSVVNGLAKAPQRPALGIIPAGTSNDLARALGLPRQLEEACRVIVERRTRPMDIGVSGDTFFVNIAGCGRMTELTYDVPSKLKTVLGQLAYFVKGLELLPMLRSIQLHIESPNFNFSGEAMLCLIGNTSIVGGFTRLLPDASMNDGLLDVILVKQVGLPELVRLTTLAMRGEHVTSDRVVYVQTPEVSVWSDDPVDLNLDGEYGGMLPRKFSVLKHHLQVIVGADSMVERPAKSGLSLNESAQALNER